MKGWAFPAALVRGDEKVGTFRYFDWRTFMAGGSTVVSAGNAIRCTEGLSDLGIDLNEEFAEAEREMDVRPINRDLLSEGSERIMWASEELGYKMELMPKFIDPVRCRKCGLCPLGCANDAKWTALDYWDNKGAEPDP